MLVWLSPDERPCCLPNGWSRLPSVTDSPAQKEVPERPGFADWTWGLSMVSRPEGRLTVYPQTTACAGRIVRSA